MLSRARGGRRSVGPSAGPSQSAVLAAQKVTLQGVCKPLVLSKTREKLTVSLDHDYPIPRDNFHEPSFEDRIEPFVDLGQDT